MFCLRIKVLRRQILSPDLKCVSKMLYYVSFCIYLYPCRRVYCALMYGFVRESILKRYIIGGTYCIFFIYVWAYLSLEGALGIDIYYIIDTQLIILFGCNFKIVVTYCIFYGISYIFRTYFVLWVHGV